MIRHFRFHPILIASLAASISVRAQTIFYNGAPDHEGGVAMDNYIEAENFTLTDATRVQGVKFYDLEVDGYFQNSFVWEIYANTLSNSPGARLFYGVATNPPRTPQGTYAGYREFFNAFDITPVVLQPGTYWLALHNGPLSRTVPLDGFFWEATFQGDSLRSNGRQAPYTGDWFSNNCPECTINPPSELAFQIEGVRGPRVTTFISATGVPRITFTTTAGQKYRVEYKDNLTDVSWKTVSGADMISGTGNAVPIDDPGKTTTTPGRRFYRVLLL